MGKGITYPGDLQGEQLRIGIVSTLWNADIMLPLRERCIAGLRAAGVEEKSIIFLEVPGAYELPFGAQKMLREEQVDGVVALGCLIKGETMHFEYISEAVSQGIMRVGLDSQKPVIFGVLTCLSYEQAEERASQDGKDHGYEWGKSIVHLLQS